MSGGDFDRGRLSDNGRQRRRGQSTTRPQARELFGGDDTTRLDVDPGGHATTSTGQILTFAGR